MGWLLINIESVCNNTGLAGQLAWSSGGGGGDDWLVGAGRTCMAMHRGSHWKQHWHENFIGCVVFMEDLF